MDHVKEAFQKVKDDIYSLNKEIELLKFGLEEVNNSLFEIRDVLRAIKESKSPSLPPTVTPTVTPTHIPSVPTHPIITPTSPTDIPTHNLPFKPLNAQIMPFSIGNEGVPTDKQTNQQTNQQTHFEGKTGVFQVENSIEHAASMLESLDGLKKEIRLKFKRLTEGEFLIFSTLYQLEEQESYADYRSLSQKLNLTESSIRDYIGRLISKGIPIEKKKVNNKNIQLNISPNLKKIASLQTILQLKDL